MTKKSQTTASIEYLTVLYYGTFMPPDVPKRAHRILDDTKKPASNKQPRRLLPPEERIAAISSVMRQGKFMAVYEIAERADVTETHVRSFIAKMNRQKMILRESQRIGGDQRFMRYRLKKDKK